MAKYLREFITLEQDFSEYSFNGKSSRGKCIIEGDNLKGKISVNILNLKPEILYKLYLISDNCAVFISNLLVDKRGVCDLKKEFLPQNVMNCGYTLEEFKVVAVVVPKTGEVISPLVGYIGGKTMWKNNFLNFIENTKKEVTVGETQKIIEKTLEKSKSQIVIEPIIETKDDIAIEPIIETKEDIVIEPIIETKEDIAIEPIIETQSEIIEKPLDEIPKKIPSSSNLEDLFTSNLQLSPFESDDDDVIWVSISLEDIKKLSSNHWDLINHPFLTNSFENYKHFILGKKGIGSSKYMLGVPLIYNNELASRVKSLGFIHFKCCEQKNPQEGDYGYYLTSCN